MLESSVKMIFQCFNIKWILIQEYALQIKEIIFQPQYYNLFYKYTLNKNGEYYTKTKIFLMLMLIQMMNYFLPNITRRRAFFYLKIRMTCKYIMLKISRQEHGVQFKLK
ncbi:unnamed protein product [Paramecium pentaurelia]|uniref:Uncharacterized protein n=1 Tax=Paramecium pentaurelia TaxID=43138 RepID=A0A8S1YIK3_9CILI|nr:unnamed protein product [Paramecium pentaurelia]